MSQPRQHHIIPQFYLAGFSDTGSRDGRVHVFDYFRGKRYKARASEVGTQRDFYRIYEEGVDPNAVEGALSELETDFASVLARVIASGRFENPADLGAILSLAALLHARGRRVRWLLSESISMSLAKKLETGSVTREQYEQLVASEARAGVPTDAFPSFNELDEAIQAGWKPKAPEVLKVGLIWEVHRYFVNQLLSRIWSIGRAEPGSSGFICSDTPLVWGQREPSDPLAVIERVDDPHVPITFPLNTELALITREDRHGTYNAERRVVAWVNSRTLFNSMGSVYWHGDQFFLERSRGRVGTSSNYFSYVEKARRRGVKLP